MGMTEKLRWYKPIIQTMYPHFPLFHRVLWDSFLLREPVDIARIAYDVCVGDGREAPPITPPNLMKDWQYLTSFKIDALAETSTGYTIFEIKTTANPESVGQLLIYRDLLKPELQPGQEIHMCIVCDSAHPDMYRACRGFGIEIIECNILNQD